MQICAQWRPSDSDSVAARQRLNFLCYSAYGVRIGLAISPDLVPYIPSPLIPGGQEEAPEPPFAFFRFEHAPLADGRSAFQVAENGSVIFLSSDIKTAARVLESRVHQYVAASTETAVFVHAGVIAWDGRAVVIPGPSHSGKSTLVAALVTAGATYYSDEYAVIDLEGRVHAFPRQLRLRADILRQQVTALPRFQQSAALPPLPLGWVWNIRYEPAGTWRPSALTPGQTLLALLENTVAVRRQSELTVKILKTALGFAAGWHSERAGATRAAQDILQFLDRNRRVSSPQAAELAI